MVEKVKKCKKCGIKMERTEKGLVCPRCEPHGVTITLEVQNLTIDAQTLIFGGKNNG
jgi:Zn finger protein HypA/HybF involved in hydrogenase expression